MRVKNASLALDNVIRSCIARVCRQGLRNALLGGDLLYLVHHLAKVETLANQGQVYAVQASLLQRRSEDVIHSVFQALGFSYTVRHVGSSLRPCRSLQLVGSIY